MTIAIPVIQAVLQNLSCPEDSGVDLLGIPRFPAYGGSHAELVRHLIELAEDAHAEGQADIAGRLVEIAQGVLDARFADPLD